MKELEGRVAIVTGAAGRIGRATVAALAERGATVVASDLSGDGLDEAIAGLDGEHATVAADLTDLAAALGLVDAAVERFGRLDILVNNGAVLETGGTIEECDEELFDRTLAVNVKAPFFLIRRAIPHMRAQGGGAIVNVASVLGLVGRAGFSSYATSKGAVVQLTRQVAVDYAAENIRCNAVCPGNIIGPDDRDLPEHAALHPAGRSGRAREVADVIAFLAGDGASFVHGAIVTVDGGFTTW